MRKKIYWLFLVVVLIGVLSSSHTASASPGPGKFAVLISTGNTTTDNLAYHSEYWYDLVLTYNMLIENGFSHDHIYVLYGFGNDFNSTLAAYQNPYPNPITDYAVSRADIQNIFNWLAVGNAGQGIPALTNNDFLFVWWMGHGGGGASCNTSFDVATTSQNVSDTELANWTAPINYRRRAFVFMTCHSGGAMDNLQNATTVTMPSCTCTQNSYSQTYDVIHGEWTYLVDVALHELLPGGTPVNSNVDSNNLVSLDEAFTWASAQPMSSTPQLDDIGNIAPCVFIRLPEPGENVEIFSRDHLNDNATIPSNYETWYHGPDLWVRRFQDGIASHQNPVYGDPAYVYANVHNIGCGSANNATVDFSWVLPTGWSNPAMWNPIGQASITSLASLNSTTVNVLWNTVPLPGDYCLHTRLNVTGDLENTDGRAYMDDNKVQINILVRNTWAGAGWTWPFFVENGSEELLPIDLSFRTSSTLPESVVRLEFPPVLKFERVEGAEIAVGDDDWPVLNLPPRREEPIVVSSLRIEPREKHRTFLAFTLPEDTKIGEEASILFLEQVDGEVVGGIQFISRAAEPKTVMCELSGEIVNVYRGLAEMYRLDQFAQAAEIFGQAADRKACGDREIFLESVIEAAELEYKAGEALQEISEIYGLRYIRATEKLLAAIEKDDILSIVEAQQEVLMYASVILTDALTK